MENINSKKKTNKKFSKSKGSKGKGKFKAEDREDIMKERPGKNDISWYGDSKLVDAAGRINFTNPLGKAIGWSFFNGTSNVTMGLQSVGVGSPESIPGVMGISIESGIGIADNQVDVPNVFMRNFYSFIRHANAGHTNYAAPDLAIYVMAIDQIHIILEHLVRIYGVARTFSAMNRYYPTAVLNAMGVDPFANNANLYETLATFRANLLTLLIKVGTLVVPKDFTIIERHRSLFKYVYMDGSTAKSQTYVFRPAGYKIYVDSGAGHTGGYLEYHDYVGTHSAWDWLGIANSMVDSVISDEDMNIMSGDILKAYGVDGTYKMEFFDENYTVVPVYNPEILLEIHNMRICGNPYTDADFDIYQDPALNIIKYHPITEQAHPTGCISPIIDMPVEYPTPEQVMIATRLSTVGTVGWESADSKYKFVPDTLGSELVTRCDIFQYATVSGVWTLGSIAFFGSVLETGNNYDWEVVGMASNFAWHPGVFILKKTSNTQFSLVQYVGDLENYTCLIEGDISKLHEVALIGEFKVPLLGLSEFGATKK